MNSSEQLRDVFDIETVMAPTMARAAAIKGSLPKNTRITGDLQLAWTQVDYLPEGLIIEGHLNLSGAPIEKLPQGLVIKRNLYMDHTGISRLPADVRVGGNIHTSFKTRAHNKPAGVAGSIYPAA